MRFKTERDLIMSNSAACNERLHASGGVFPQTVLCGFGVCCEAKNFPVLSPAAEKMME